MWKPKNPRSVALIKLAVWTGLIAWMVFAVAYSVVAAQRLAQLSPQIFGTSAYGEALSFIAPAWIIFTTLMLCWAIARWVNKKFRKRSA